MDELREYLNSLSVGEQVAFAARCRTSIGYLRKAISVRSRIGDRLAIAIDRESGGRVTCESVAPDTDWAYLRKKTASRRTS